MPKYRISRTRTFKQTETFDIEASNAELAVRLARMRTTALRPDRLWEDPNQTRIDKIIVLDTGHGGCRTLSAFTCEEPNVT